MKISSSVLLGMRNISKKVVEKIETYFIFSNSFRKSCHLWDNGEKYGTAR